LLKLAVVAVAVLAVYFVVTFVQVWSAARRDAARPAGAIVVLGAAQYNGVPSPALRVRLDHAIELYHRGFAPKVVLTGGRLQGDRFTEAGVGFAYLRGAGIPESALELENQGTNTWESLAAVARFLQAEGVHEVVLVSSPYHSLRVEHIADDVGLVGHASPARSASGLGGLGSLLRETVAVGFGRIIGYRRLVDIEGRVGAPAPVTRRAPDGRLAEGALVG
jgi:uncharacterized SAM-binding protein YcdF (DUF218 family)